MKSALSRARVFFALWPDPEIRAALAALANAIQAETGGRATPAAKIHLTLFFLGHIERARLPALRRIGSEVGVAPFDIAFDRLGYFRHNRIAWLGATSSPSGLLSLVEELRDKLRAEGVKPEERAYVPHVTLVREAGRKLTVQVSSALAWRAREFALVESITSAPSRYETIESWTLR